MPGRTTTPRSVFRRARSAALAVALGWAVVAGATPTAAQEGDEPPWPMVGRDAAHGGTLPDGPAPPYREAWRAQVPGGPRGGPVVAGGAVIVVGGSSVAALDAATGETRWQAARSEGPAGPPAVAGDLVVHASGRGERASIVARRVQDGREVWRFFAGGAPLGGPAADGNRVFVGVRTGFVVALDAESGEEAWRFRTKGRLEGSPAVADATVIAVSEDLGDGRATVYALDARSGRRSWAFSPEGVSVGVSSPAVLGETVFVGMGDGQVHALGLASGREIWSHRALAAGFSAQAFASGAVPAAGDDVVISDIATVYRLDPATGNEAWSFRDPRWELRREDLLVAASPIVSGEMVLIGNGSGVVTAIDLGSGVGVWRRDVGDGPIGPMAADPDRAYVVVQGPRGGVVSLEHDPQGALVVEESATLLSPRRAVLNFAAALALVGVVILGLFRYAVPWLGRLRGPAPEERP
ncbi:MAG: PQQ-binding-like beta-propeller repeat protein [Actinomycetota bacterium]